MDYTLLLSTQLDTSSIQSQLQSLASQYKINIQANIDTSQISQIQSQVANVQNGINAQSKSTMLIDPTANTAALDELKVQAQQIQAAIEEAGGTASKTSIFAGPTGDVVKATTTFKDELGNTVVQTQKLKQATDEEAASIQTTTKYTNDASVAEQSLMGNWFDQMGSVIQRTIQWSVALAAVYGTFRSFQDGIQYVIDLNAAMTNTEMITGQTSQQVQGLYTNYQQMAQQLGVTTMEISQASDTWLRQGKSAQDAATLTQASVMMSKLAVTDTQTAAQNLTAIMNGFQMSASDANSVMDKMVTLSNSAKTSAATSFQTLSAAMQYSAAIAHDTGVSYDQLASYIATIGTITQASGETIGQGLKTMFTRFESLKAGATEDGIALNNVDKVLQNVGLSLRDTNGNFIDLGTIIDEVGQKWATLDGFQQRQLVTAIAGKNTNARTYRNIWINNNIDKNYISCYN